MLDEFKLVYNDNIINYKIKNNARTTKISFSCKEGKVIVTKPVKYPVNKVKKLVNENIDLIYKLYKKYDSLLLKRKEILFLGKRLDFKIVYGNNEIKVIDNIFYIFAKDIGNEELIRTIIKDYFKNFAYKILALKLDFWTSKMGLDYNIFKVKYMTTRWGSCIKGTKTLNFNSKIVMLQDRVIDLIVVHELCHLVHANHQMKFWNLLSKYVPDYKILDKWLKNNSSEFLI